MSKTASYHVRHRNCRTGDGSIDRIYLDIGGKSVLCERVIGIFDMDNATTEKATVEFLGGSEKEGRLRNLCADIPVSFVVCDDEVYLSPSSGRTLARTVNGKNNI